MSGTFRKVKWRVIPIRWHALNPAEKVIAIAILAHSDKDGWAKMALGELQKSTGGLHYHTIHQAVARLEELGALQVAKSDQKRKKLYRLHESGLVRKEIKK